MILGMAVVGSIVTVKHGRVSILFELNFAFDGMYERTVSTVNPYTSAHVEQT